MDVVGSIYRGSTCRQIRRSAQEYALSIFGNRVERHSRIREILDRRRIARQHGENVAVTLAASGIHVLAVDQLAHGALPIPHHLRRTTLRYGGHLAVHHQDPVIASLRVLLDDDSMVEPDRLSERFSHLVIAVEPAGNPAAMTRIERLHDDRIPDFVSY